MKYFFKILLLLLILGCKTNIPETSIINISHDNSKIYYEGRIGENEDNTASEIYWPGLQ